MPTSASLQAESKDPFASRNGVLLCCFGIIKLSDGVVRQAVFAVKPIVGARMKNKNRVRCLVEFRVVASNPSLKRTRLAARRSAVR